MYQVIKMYGDNEPWWFFDEWQKDIVEIKEFSELALAEKYFHQESSAYQKNYPHEKFKEPYLQAFWQDGQSRWCEECDDDLQQYHGMLLLKDFQKLTIKEKGTTQPTGGKKCCRMQHPLS